MGAIVKKIRNIVAWAEPHPKTAFIRVFMVPFDCPVHSLQETRFTPNEWQLWRAKTLETFC